MNQAHAQAAWNQMESLGGHGVWESELAVVSLAGTAVTDDDLSFFADLPFATIVDLSRTAVTDNCLRHLEHLTALESLIIIDTAISRAAIEQFKLSHPSVEVHTQTLPKAAINPFTGKPFNPRGT
jgi:hypothetical protein